MCCVDEAAAVLSPGSVQCVSSPCLCPGLLGVGTSHMPCHTQAKADNAPASRDPGG